MLEAYYCLQTSLRRKRNLTSTAGMSNVREASRRSLFWAPNGLNVVCFELPLIKPYGKSTMAFSTGQS